MLYRHLVEQNGKNALLHLSSIFSTQDDHLLLSEINCNGCGGCHPGCVSVGREGAGIIDGIVGVEIDELFSRWPDEHVTHEESMVGSGTDDSNVDAVPLIPSSKAIDDIDTIPCI